MFDDNNKDDNRTKVGELATIIFPIHTTYTIIYIHIYILTCYVFSFSSPDVAFFVLFFVIVLPVGGEKTLKPRKKKIVTNRPVHINILSHYLRARHVSFALRRRHTRTFFVSASVI